MDTSAVPDAGAGPATTPSAPSLPQGTTAGAGVPGWWHGPDGTQPPATPGTGSQAGSAVPAVWGGRPAVPAGWGRPDGPARGETALARSGSGLGVRVDPGQGGSGQGGLGLGGRGGRPGEPGQDGQEQRRRRSLRKAIWDWFFGPLHESPDPIPAWLARLLLRCWPTQAGQQDEPTGTAGAGAGAGTAAAVQSGGGAR